MYTQLKLKFKVESFESKHLHGYVHKQILENSSIDKKRTREWTTNFMTSHFRTSASAITKKGTNRYTDEKNYISNHQQQINVVCVRKKYATHILSSCSQMSCRYYLPLRHDVIAK